MHKHKAVTGHAKAKMFLSLVKVNQTIERFCKLESMRMWSIMSQVNGLVICCSFLVTDNLKRYTQGI